MKLHLPKGLRTALLAVFSFATIATTAAAADDTPFTIDRSAAKYAFKVDKNPSIVNVQSGQHASVAPNLSMRESWVLSVGGYFYPEQNKKDDSDDFVAQWYVGSVLVGNIEVPRYEKNLEKDKVEKPKGMKKNQFAIYRTDMSTIYAVTPHGVKKICDTGLFLYDPIQITLNWVYNEETGKGSLYLLAVDACDVDQALLQDPNSTNLPDDEISDIVETTRNLYTGPYTLLKDVAFTDEDLQQYGTMFTTAITTEFWESGFVQTTYAASKDPKDKAWLITGYTDVEKMLNTRTYGKQFQDGEMVQFTGSSGALVYTGTNSFEYNITNTTVDNNILMGDMLKSVGFGAWNKSGTLTVKKDVLEHNAFELPKSGIKIVGKGTVKLELGSNTGYDKAHNTSNFQLISMEAGSTLKFSNEYDEDFSLDLRTSEIGEGANIIRTSESTNKKLVIELDNGATEPNYFKFGTLSNENGGLTLYGGNVIESSSGNYMGDTYAQVDADTISALNTSTDPYSGLTLYGGVYNAKNVTTNGEIAVGAFGAGTPDYLRTTLNVKEKLSAGGAVRVTGSAHLGTATADSVSFTYNSVVNNTLSADSITAKSISIDVSDKENPILDTNEADLPIIPASISINSTSGDKALLVSGGFSVKTSDTNSTIETGSISNSNISLVAGSIDEIVAQADGSTETKTYNSKVSEIRATNIDNINFSYANKEYSTEKGSWVGDDVSVLKNASGKNVTLSSSGISAASMTAKSLALPHDKYELSFGELTVTDKLEAGGSQYLSNVAMTGVTNLKSNALTAASVSADNITLSKGFVFDSSLGTEKATLKAADTLDVGENATLNNADISTGQGLTLNNNTTLNNTQLSGRIITNGKIDFNQAGFTGMGSEFGGNDGQAFTVDPAKAGVESVIMDADLDGDYLRITDMDLYAEGLTFTADGNTYEVITADAASGGAVDYEVKPSNNSIYIQPWVKARIEMLDSKVVITGREAMEEIKEELCTSDNRTAAMDAIDELEPVIRDGSPLSRMHDYLGHVHRYSQSEREALLSAISGASTTALADSQRRGVMDVQNNLRNRIIQMGGATSDNNSDWDYKGLQAWAQADGSFASISGSDDAPGYNYDTWGATVGADIELSSSTVLGISCSASYGDIDVDGADHAKGTNDAQYVSLFARYQSNRWVQMLILTAGQNEFELDRNVLGYTGEGSTEGTTLSAYYELGYTMGLNYEYTQILQPLFSVRITKAEIDKYSESGNIGNASIDYKGDSFVYGSVSIGARYQGVLYTSAHERNAVVEARALISQDFGDATDEAEVALGGGSMYKVNGAETFGTSLELGAGLSIPLQQHTTLFADADLSVSGDYNSFRANIGLRYDF